ncbi:MAG: glycoside hydrolase [Lentisphaerae bacterium]|nr:glycoside hydrolase [Lentisphaerota bacterium]
MKLTDIQMRDPFVLPVPKEGRYLLFGTTDKNLWSGPGTGFDCYESRDLHNWSGPIPAFRPPADFWANTQFWAPECHAWQGRYYVFASFARDERQRGTQILVADQPEGPYQPHSDGPVTPRDWECLDGTFHVDADGKPWMIFCHEWVQVGNGEMCAIPLSADLRCAISKPVLLFRAAEAAWSSPFESRGRKTNQVTDGPFLHRLAGGKLLMLWSTMGAKGVYTMGYAVSDGSILGPWRQSEKAIFVKDGGHGMLFRDFNGRLWMTLHRPNNTPNERPMWVEVIERDEGLVVGEAFTHE